MSVGITQIGWSFEERAILGSFDTPYKIQRFLDTMQYSIDETYRCPRSVLRDHVAHCFDGALFAAAVFAYHGERPLLLDMRAIDRDDHVLAVFKMFNRYGAVSKSNYTGLRYREGDCGW